MAPGTPRSSGKIVIKPRKSRGRPRASTAANTSSARPTIRIPRGAAAAAAAKREEDTSDDEPREEDEESSLTSQPIASSSKATPQANDDSADDEPKEDNAEDDAEQEADRGHEEAQDVDVDGEGGGDGDEDDGGSEHGDTDAVGTPRDGEDADEEPVPVRRGRGRPRGRGRGASVSGSATPRAARGRGRGRGRGRRGRPPGSGKSRAAEEGESSVADEDAEEAGGKPFRRIQGKVYIIDGDEFITDNNEKGDTKIDPNGNLLGDRAFKAQTFTLPNRHPERKYMLAIDAARTSGFRDSLYYFRRNPLALKLNATQWEKEHLIEQGKLGSHLKTRSVTLITARSAYKLHGAKMVRDGRWIIDDYDEEKTLQEITEKGLKPGELVGDLQDVSNLAAEAAALGISRDAMKQERAAASGGGGGGPGIYRAGGPTTIFGGSGWGPYSDGPLNAVRKSFLNREGLNEENWMLIAAQRTREADEEWKRIRRTALEPCGGILGRSNDVGGEQGYGDAGAKRTAGEDGDGDVDVMQVEPKRRRVESEQSQYPLGIYDPQTGIVLYRNDTQPLRSRWESVEDTDKPKKGRVLGGSKVGSNAWGLAWVDTVMELPNGEEEEALRLNAMRLLKVAEEEEVQAQVAQTSTAAGTSSASTPAAMPVEMS
ncbi:hypothetical protein EIP86_004046 [Pleurotus ostreatoroseus]|nr:hypothetical protein EIP86_004046 [Pleurotus ostreatoroseus]